MINVLPLDQKIALRKEYRLRLVTLCLFVFSILVFLASFLLLPAYVLSKEKVSTLEIQLQKYNEENPTTSVDNLTKLISNINNNLAILNKENPSISVVDDMLGTILASRVSGITISRMSYRMSLEEKNTFELNGRAVDRASLRSFEDKLKESSKVESTDLPVSNFTKRSNIDYSLTVTFK